MLHQAFQVNGRAMEPTLQYGQTVLIDITAYRIASPQRGDLILVQSPRDLHREFIKRVVGMPGEIIDMHDGTVFVDGSPLSEPYLSTRNRSTDEMTPVLVPPHSLLILGDNRMSSYDSRHWGVLDEGLVIGKALLAP